MASSSTPLRERNKSSTEVLLSTSRNVNRVLKYCIAMDKSLKEQAISFKKLQEEMAKLKSTIKTSQRSEYSLKRAGHEVDCMVQVLWNCGSCGLPARATGRGHATPIELV